MSHYSSAMLPPNPARLLHVGFFNFVMTNAIAKALEDVFEAAPDWMRYSDDNWIIYTKNSAKFWDDRLLESGVLPDGYGVLIAPIDVKSELRRGRMFDWQWEWLNKHNP